MASSFSLPATLNPPLTGRDAVVDAMYRCAVAWDTNDQALFDSTFLPDGVFLVNGRPMTGLSEIHSTGLALIFAVDTTHFVTNVRVSMKVGAGETAGAAGDENEASLTATVFVQHFAGGKGMEADQPSLMSGSLYRGELVEDVDGLWKFKRLAIKATWVEGDWGVVGGKFHEVKE
ncbi:unnamed protein product [Clonostachys chloroleuca]|uniref:SnoaL-like domain-containing protein n=1 Tax=Clonostachys chloroleuca TaxID=1926264 RepID=A0AA35QF25_9HYPO|nr:unnamed protein product [Clonostachys chloroleuca]